MPSGKCNKAMTCYVKRFNNTVMLTAKTLLIAAGIAIACSCNNPGTKVTPPSPPSFSKSSNEPAKDRKLIAPDTAARAVPVFSKADKAVNNTSPATASQTNAATNVLPYGTLLKSMEKMSRPAQVYTVNNTDGRQIYCTQGTVLKIPPNSFVFGEDSTAVPGTVQVTIREFYSLDDIIFSNLTTRCGDKILETAGMVYIEATANGKACVLKAGASAELKVPYYDKKNGMELFMGIWENNSINWTPAVNKDDIRYAAGYIPFRDQAVVQNFIARNIGPIQDTASKISIVVKFDITEDGRTENVRLLSGAPPAFEEVVVKVFRHMPALRPASSSGKAVRATQTMTITLVDRPRSDMWRQGMYAFTLSGLGWINIDRYIDRNRPQIEFAVNTGPYDELDVKLVFSSMTAVVPMTNIQNGAFASGIPKGEIMHVVVIKKWKGKVYLAIKPAVAGVTAMDNLAFEAVNLPQVKSRLKDLSYSWN